MAKRFGPFFLDAGTPHRVGRLVSQSAGEYLPKRSVRSVQVSKSTLSPSEAADTVIAWVAESLPPPPGVEVQDPMPLLDSSLGRPTPTRRSV
jgi:hypothetical protein